MPATLQVAPPAAAPTRPLSAPPSRSGDAVHLPSRCMGCGAEVPSWGYRNVDGVGVLTHETVTDCEPCPQGRAFSFDWNTGESA